MQTGTLARALEREHRDIDGGIEAFVQTLTAGTLQPEPLITALDALRRHIYLEEKFLFPPLREAGMAMPIFVMVREHGKLWTSMGDLKDLLADTADHQQLLDICREMLELLDRHNSKEEPIIYPQADGTLSSDAGAELADFLQTGTLPDGWVCAGA